MLSARSRTSRHPRPGRLARRVAATAAVAATIAVGAVASGSAGARPSVIDASSTIDSAATATLQARRLALDESKPIWPMQTTPFCLSLGNYGASRSGGRTHVGNDIIADPTVGYTQAVYAVVTGTLTYQYLDNPTDPGNIAGNGWRLTSATSRTYYTYLHMSTFAPGLQVGSPVRQGQLIGYVGDTGNDPGNYHLHFEVHPTGTSSVTVNPLSVLTVPRECKP